MTIRATYRLQLHHGFTFKDAEAIVPYLARLGVSHAYCSPITTAQPGSMHGYDVTDPTRVNPELGGEEGFRRLVAALGRHGMGAVVDIVPNHMGVAGGMNPWWNDVLARGRDSPYARFFDIDWSEKLLLPFLGRPLEEALASGDIRLRERDGRVEFIAYGSQPYPLRNEDQRQVLAAGLDHYDPATMAGQERLSDLLARQHYRLGWWRTANDLLNWRRFFTISELAGLRAEDDAVFEATHALCFRLYGEGLIDGIRIDHVDGLTDPAGYCRKLRARLRALADREPYIIVEKILATDETIPPDWGVDGTSGYDFMEQAAALLHAPEAESSFGQHWARLSGRPADFAEEEYRARKDMLAWEFEGQLSRCVRAFVALACSAQGTRELTPGMLRRAIERLLWVFPAYRTYGTGASAPESDAALRNAARDRALPLAPPGEKGVIEAVVAWLAGRGPGSPALAAEAVRRFQQLSAPVAAKAVEDTAFYRYGRLLSRNDVGFDPARFSMSTGAFHAAMAERRELWPRSMLATATHDHKRGEDVRMRLAALSEVPEEWIGRVGRWSMMNTQTSEGIDPADMYQLYQTIYGAWPVGLAPDDAQGLADFAGRVKLWQEKALREAKLRSSWAAPAEEYEARVQGGIDALLDPARSAQFLHDLQHFVRRMTPATEANGLVQTLLHCTAPGIPDFYQGTEFADFSLVDPDNRRPVDYGARMHALDHPGADYDSRKQTLIARILELRRARPELWARGSYEPIPVEGPRSDHVLAFVRRCGGSVLVVAASLRCWAALSQAADPRGWWGATRLRLPAMPAPPLHDTIEGRTVERLPDTAAALFVGTSVRLYASGDG